MYREYITAGIILVSIGLLLLCIGVYRIGLNESNIKLKNLLKQQSKKNNKLNTIYLSPTEKINGNMTLYTARTQLIRPDELDEDVPAEMSMAKKEIGNCRKLERGTIINHRYRVERVLGEGVQSNVYVCTNLELGNTWAIKHFEGNWNEKDILVKLNHISFPKIADVFSEGKERYVVESYVEGESLDKYVETHKEELSEEIALSFMIQLAEALRYIHEHSIVHMDIKPQNIIITENQKAILVDFGIASIRNEEARVKYKIRGYTPNFASPEQKMLLKDIDERTDIYSLGVTIVYAFRDISISKEYSEILKSCLSEEKENRFENIKELLSALKKVQAKKSDALQQQKKNLIYFRLAIPFLIAGIACWLFYLSGI